MVYTSNIPMSTDDPSASQPLILGNFQQLNIQYGTSGDHVPFTASSGNGSHNKVTWLNQSAAIPSSNVQQIVAYGKTVSGVTMPYYQRDSLVTEYPLAPIKAFASISITGAVVTFNSSFNINTAGVTNPALGQFTFPFTNNMVTSNYGVVATGLTRSGGVTTSSCYYSGLTMSQFTLVLGVPNNPLVPTSYTFICVEL